MDSIKSPFKYFSNQEDSLNTSLKAIQKNHEIINNIRELSRAPLLLHNDNVFSQNSDTSL